MSTLDLEFLEHRFFCFLRKECFIQKTTGEELRVCFEEDISTVKAQEKLYNSGKSRVDLLFRATFESLL